MVTFDDFFARPCVVCGHIGDEHDGTGEPGAECELCKELGEGECSGFDPQPDEDYYGVDQ